MYYLPIEVMGQESHCKPLVPKEWWNCHHILSEVMVVKETETLKCYYNSCLHEAIYGQIADKAIHKPAYSGSHFRG